MFENIVLYTKTYFYKVDAFVKSFGNNLIKIIKLCILFNFIFLPLLLVLTNILNLNEFSEKIHLMLFPDKYSSSIDYSYMLIFSGHFIFIFKKLFLCSYEFVNYLITLPQLMYSNTFEFVYTDSNLEFAWFVKNFNIHLFYGEFLEFIQSFLFNIKLSVINFFFDGVHTLDLPIFFYFGILFVLTTVISLLLMSYLGLYGVFFINLVSIILFWVSTVLYIDDFFLKNNFFKINVGKWFTIMLNTDIYFELLIDSVSYSFMLLTVTIATFVYIYIFSYFRYDANVERLTLFINLFVISMVLLVTSGNFFVMFLGWELIGLTSFFFN